MMPIEILRSPETRPSIARKVQELSEKYEGIRRVRGDGNCFYRAYLLALFVEIAENPIEMQPVLDNLIKRIDASKSQLMAAGFPEYVIDDFWSTFINELRDMEGGKRTVGQIEASFASMDISDYLVTYARLLTSWFLRKNEEQYMPYIQDYPDMVRILPHF